MVFKRLLLSLALGALVVGALPFTFTHARADAVIDGVAPAGNARYQAVCPPATPGHVTCFSFRRTDVAALAADAAPAAIAGFKPADLQAAYNLASAAASAGNGQILADVLWFDDPTAESDLNVYRAAFGLPACTTANGCFKKVDQNGGTNYPHADAGSAGEISLDLDMFSAICPKCKIVLVEARDNSNTNIGIAENQAAAQGATAIDNSYGGSESSSDNLYDTLYYNHPGIAVTASSGDGGYGASYPASSPYVTSVGGTSLSKTSQVSRGWYETTWSCYGNFGVYGCNRNAHGGTGSGCSAFAAKPAWQTDTACAKRTVADVSAVADPATGVAVYQTYGGSGWAVYGGTSASAPIVAGIYALAGNAASLTYGSYPYSHTSALNDVTKGLNYNPGTGCAAGSYLCFAKVGYDGPTGLGTPNGTGAF